MSVSVSNNTWPRRIIQSQYVSLDEAGTPEPQINARVKWKPLAVSLAWLMVALIILFGVLEAVSELRFYRSQPDVHRNWEFDRPLSVLEKDLDVPVVHITIPDHRLVNDDEEAECELSVHINSTVNTRISARVPTLNMDDSPGRMKVKSGIEYKGKTSRRYKKRSFKIEFWDADNDGVDRSFLGMPAHEDWVFRGPYSDPSLIRDKLGLDIWRRMSSNRGDWGIDSKFVEVVMNDSYDGLYVLTEAIKRGDNRLVINKNKKDTPIGDGGYLIERNGPGNSDNCVGEWEFKYPKCSKITNEQKSHIENRIKEIDNLAKDATRGLVDIDALSDKINVASFVDMFLLDELSKDMDMYQASRFFYIKGGDSQEFFAGPAWDFDKAFDSPLRQRPGKDSSGEPNGFGFLKRENRDLRWWPSFLAVPGVVDIIKARWQELRPDILHTDAFMNITYEYKQQIHDAALRNDARWGTFGFCKFDHVPIYHSGKCFGETLYEAVGRVEGWLIDRLEWMDGAINRLTTDSARDMISNIDYTHTVRDTWYLGARKMALPLTFVGLALVSTPLAIYITYEAYGKTNTPYEKTV